MADILRDSPGNKLLVSWLRRFDDSPAKVVSTTPLAVVTRGDKTIASFVDTVIETEQGQRFPRCILLRGDSAIVIAILRVLDTGELLTVMVEQLRPVDGKYTLEFVGGMCDNGETPSQCAVREVEEELGILIRENDLISLFPEPIRVCTAMLDERAHFFAFHKPVDATFIRAWEGMSLGDHSDGEYLRARIVDFDLVGKQPTFSAQVGLLLVSPVLKDIEKSTTDPKGI